MSTHWPWQHDGHGESNTRGETECYGRSYSTGISHSESKSVGTPIESIWGSSSYITAQPNTRVRSAAAPLEKQIRALAEYLTLAEFHAVRTRLEDCCDEILLNSI
jgi:hypothetical protein